jgi:hypothetical protein
LELPVEPDIIEIELHQDLPAREYLSTA